MLKVAKFMASSTGRWVRLGMGVVMIGAGALVVQGVGGLLLALAGIPPLISGTLNYCPVAPMLKLQAAQKSREASRQR